MGRARVGRVGQRQRQHGIPHGRVGPKPLPCGGKRHNQVLLVQADQRRDLLGFGSDQRTCELRFRKHRIGRQQDQHLIQIRRKGLAAQFVLSPEQVAARIDRLDGAFVCARLPAHPVAHQHFAFFAARVADQTLAVVGLDHAVPAIARHHQTRAQVSCGRCIAAQWRPRDTGCRNRSAQQRIGLPRCFEVKCTQAADGGR